MPHLIDRRHLDFVLDDVLRVGDLLSLPAFEAHDREGIAAILDTAEAIAREQFLPSHRLVDDNEPRIENGRVVLPAEIAMALAAFREAGFLGMVADQDVGGLGLPRTAANAAFLQFQAANVSIANYALLSMSAAELLAHHATAEQKARWLAPIIDGRYFGTMALSEPHAGSSLGDITTRATPRPDGTYSLRGTKMWISGGEHDMAANIVHLMLARIDGAAPGVKGISLFIVPRWRAGCGSASEGAREVRAGCGSASEGARREWNCIALAGLNHKLGQRGTVNTVLNVGEGGETVGEIVGAPGQGLACMFTMMNEARIGVSMGAVAHASAGYVHALAYARDRVQGRHPDSKDPTSPQVPLIEHADVRRMLLQQKAAAEGGVALGLYLAKLADLKKAAAIADQRADASLMLDFLTPIFKAWMSEESLRANWNAMQVLGGAGYTRDHPVELHYRDNRLNPIHEGTNGIQAIDLLGRKAVMAEGRALNLLIERLRKTALRARRQPQLAGYGTELEDAAARCSYAVSAMTARREQANARAALSEAHYVMELFGLTTFAWIWLEMALASLPRADHPDAATQAFHRGKLQTCRYVFCHRLVETRTLIEIIVRPDAAVYDMRDAWF